MTDRVSSFLLKNGRVIDPSRKIDDVLDLIISEGKILQIGKNISAGSLRAMDVSGLVIAPGFVDLHVHLREPGKEEAETIHTGTLAGAAGGFTAVACMPNTNPVNDNVNVTKFILEKAKKEGVIAVLPIAAITKKQEGKELTDVSALKRAGIVAISDDGKPVASADMMRAAMEAALRYELPVIDHCEDPTLASGAAMHQGAISEKLGYRGMPAAAEEVMVSRNIILAQQTGAHIHLAHMSTAGSIELIRQGKARGVRVTCEVTPHHFSLTDEAVLQHGTHAKMNPPLRSAKDVEAVLKAISDGTVDVIASDHAPHHADTKTVAFENAAFGITGLETSVALGLDRLVNSGLISINRFIELYSQNAARMVGLQRTIQEGAEASLTIFHPTKEFTVKASESRSKSRNTPFDGWNLKGSPMATIYKGRLVWNDPSLKSS
jgi:dihydroorotase